MSTIPVRYCKDVPSNQTVVDIFKGEWYSAFPDECGVTAGQVRHFDYSVEGRVKWADGIIPGGIRGKTVLELGPFEAYNTWQLEDLGASAVTAVEANNLSYLKCLVVKELTGLKARFLYGDFLRYLEEHRDPVDIVWASGVLYHQTEPLRLLDLITGITDRIFIHTHYYEDAVMDANWDVKKFFVPERDVVREVSGYSAKHHYRSYSDTPPPPPKGGFERFADELSERLGRFKDRPVEKGSVFSGGLEVFCYWLEQKDIFGFLEKKGFRTVAVAVDDKQNPNGPAMIFLSERTP